MSVMPLPNQDQTELKSLVYGTLKLYEALMRLCFAVKNKTVASTEVDDLYVYLELRDILKGLLGKISPHLPQRLPRNLLPESISEMTHKQYDKLQIFFGVIKTYAKIVKAHGSTIDPEIQNFICKAEKVRMGEPLATNILLSESVVEPYNYETKTLSINDTNLVFNADQEDYFLWAMFQHKLGVSISWDELRDEITNEYHDDQVFGGGCESMRQAMHRINRKIKAKVGTANEFFTYKRRGFTRHHGPEI